MRSVFNVIDSELSGRRLIEASAGTGKTFSLIHIVVRLIVEERIPIERLLLVTFTKAATAELKMRVRELLIRAQEAFAESVPDDSRYDPTLLALIKKWRKAGIEASHASDSGEGQPVKAALPGTVLKVLVGVGDTIAEGDVIAVIEAMKMETEIKSPLSGVVKSVDIEVGNQVKTGQELVTIG